MIMLMSMLVSFITFFFVVCLVLAIRNKRSVDIFYRLRRHNILPATMKDDEDIDLVLQFHKFIQRISKPLVERNLAQSVEYKLKQAGIPLLGGEFIMLNLLVMALTSVLTWFITLNFVFAGGAAALVPVAFWIAMIVLKSRRLGSFTEQLGDCLITISNALRAGYSFQQTIEVISKEMEPPIGEEFSNMNHEIVMGVPLEEALENANKRIGSPDFELVVTAVLIQREVGGNLAQVLDNISYTIMERIRMRREVVALTAQGRFSAMVLLGLPFAAALAMYMLNRSSFMLLFEDPLGRMAVMGGMVMEVIGYFVIMRIVDVEV